MNQAVLLAKNKHGDFEGWSYWIEEDRDEDGNFVNKSEQTNATFNIYFKEFLNIYNVAKSFCKAAYRVDRAQDMGLAVACAVRTAVSGRPGGVYLDLPAATISDMATKTDTKIYKVVDPAPKQLPSDDGNRGKFKTIGMPFTLSNYKPDYKRAPDLGENNKEILTSLGYDPDQIEDLVNKGVISKVEKPSNPRTEVIKGKED